MKYLTAVILLVLFITSGCSGTYSFTGGDVGEAKTVSVQLFQNYADLVQPQLSQKLTDAVRDIFVQQTPLRLVDETGDLAFEGSITDYRITPLNAQASDIGAVAQNRLTVVVNVIFTNKLEPKKSFEKRFSRYADFPAEADFSSEEERLLDQITSELSENILNEAIGDW